MNDYTGYAEKPVLDWDMDIGDYLKCLQCSEELKLKNIQQPAKILSLRVSTL